MNLTIEGIFPGSNMLSVVVVDEMAKAAELKSDSDLMAGSLNISSLTIGVRKKYRQQNIEV